MNCASLALLLVLMCVAGFVYAWRNPRTHRTNRQEWMDERKRTKVLETVKEELEEAGLL